MEKEKRMLLLVNPYAGKKQAQNSLCDIVDQLNKAGWRGGGSHHPVAG